MFVGRILDLSPESGERMVLCSLRAQGIKVQRHILYRNTLFDSGKDSPTILLNNQFLKKYERFVYHD